jgi:hypothetical protein
VPQCFEVFAEVFAVALQSLCSAEKCFIFNALPTSNKKMKGCSEFTDRA